MGVALFEHGSSAVGGGDLLHDMQAEDVGSILRGFRLFERGQHGGRVADAVVGEGQAELTAADLGTQANGHRLRVVPDAVAEQVFHQPPQKGGVCRDLGLFGIEGLGQREVALVGQGAVAELGHQLPQQRADGQQLPPEGLGSILELAGQVQIVDEGAQPLALGADATGFLPCRGGQGCILLQLFGPA